ncbi:MAG: hypothetical protein JO305_00855 [Alphaproteobacteria bacterium]|nr:hypothetical protein [Alphaproteobacteria bacterium]
MVREDEDRAATLAAIELLTWSLVLNRGTGPPPPCGIDPRTLESLEKLRQMVRSLLCPGILDS